MMSQIRRTGQDHVPNYDMTIMQKCISTLPLLIIKTIQKNSVVTKSYNYYT